MKIWPNLVKIISISIYLFNISPVIASTNSTKTINGAIKIDGSSTVYPITEAIAEEFQKAHPQTRVTVGISGTGGGLKKFLNKEIDLTGASRPISAPEITLAKEKNISFHQITVAYDGITLVVHKNSPIEKLTMEQLKKIWEPDSKIKKWKDLDPSFPDEEIKLYGPGGESGTFEFFTETVVGKPRASRSNYTASEDDNILVRGVSQDKYALGYFGYAYFFENQNHLKALKIEKDGNISSPTEETIKNLTYPLARPIYIYVSLEASQKDQVAEFIKYYLTNADSLVPQVGYISLGTPRYEDELKKWETWKESFKKSS